MTHTEMMHRLAELQAEHLPPLIWSDLLTETPDAPLSESEKAALNDYFKQFVAIPTNQDGKSECLCCRSVMRGGIEGALLGGAPGSTTLEWGLAHGEAFCRVCRWPFRVYHYDIGGTGPDALIKSLVVPLAVHPSLIQIPLQQVS